MINFPGSDIAKNQAGRIINNELYYSRNRIRRYIDQFKSRMLMSIIITLVTIVIVVTVFIYIAFVIMNNL